MQLYPKTWFNHQSVFISRPVMTPSRSRSNNCCQTARSELVRAMKEKLSDTFKVKDTKIKNLEKQLKKVKAEISKRKSLEDELNAKITNLNAKLTNRSLQVQVQKCESCIPSIAEMNNLKKDFNRLKELLFHSRQKTKEYKIILEERDEEINKRDEEISNLKKGEISSNFINSDFDDILLAEDNQRYSKDTTGNEFNPSIQENPTGTKSMLNQID